MTKAIKAVDQALGWLLVILMGTAVANVLWQVFTRFVLDNPSSFTDELARYLLIWIGLLGAAFAAGRKKHLAIDLLPSKLEGQARFFVETAVEVCVFLFAACVLLYGGVRLVALTLSLGQTSAALQVPIGYIYLALPLSGLLIMFYSICAVYEHSTALRESETKGQNTGGVR